MQGNAKTCKDEVQKTNSTNKQCTSLQEEECCSNQSFFKTGDDTIKKASVEVGLETIVFLDTFFYTYVNLFEGLNTTIVHLNEYRPPLLSKDIQILDEIYLI